MKIKLLIEDFTVCKVKNLNEDILKNKFVFVGKTDDEISLVCESSKAPKESEIIESGWKCFKIDEMLDFALVGIVSKISTILANENVSVFVISTFNTDYIMIKKEKLDKAINALKKENYIVEE